MSYMSTVIALNTYLKGLPSHHQCRGLYIYIYIYIYIYNIYIYIYIYIYVYMKSQIKYSKEYESDIAKNFNPCRY